jgi:hypothetical protein
MPIKDDFKYFLLVVDCWSYMTYVVNLTNKTDSAVREGFKEIFAKSGNPEMLQTGNNAYTH